MNELAEVTDDLPEQREAEPPEAWVFPVSFAQRHLWSMDQAEPGNAAHHIPGAYRIRGRLDPVLLERSFNEVIGRHEALRTTIRLIEGEPMQIVSAAIDFRLAGIDLRPLNAAARETEAARIVREEFARPFDLREGPLIRAVLLDLTPSEQRLIITVHQIISDCASQELFIEELAAVYCAQAKGAAPALAELPIQFADFAAWQRETMQGEILEKEQAFWRERLAGIKPLEFPAEGCDSAPEGATLNFTLPEALAASLRAGARREGVSLFMTLLAGWKMLLAQRTGQTDIAVSTPVAGRERPETGGLIGYFLNTMVLRTDLAGKPSVREVLHRVRASVLEGLTHQEIPFDLIIEGMEPIPRAGKDPFLRAMFVLISAAEKSWSTPGGVIEPLGVDEPKPRFDIMLRVRDSGEGVTGLLAYDRAVFTPEAVRQLAADYQKLLAEISAHPDAAALSLLEPGHATPDAPQEAAPDCTSASEHPATWMEATLVEIWEGVLDRRPIAVTDDFFDLGGDSLLAIRMLVELAKRTGIQIAPRVAFEYPTIRQLAIEARHPAGISRSAMVAVQSGGSQAPFFFLHGDFVEGGLYCVKMARQIGPDRPFYAIEPHGVHDEPPHSIEEMAASRIELIRQVRPHGPYVLGGFCNGGLVAFEMARQLEAAGERVSSLILVSVDGSNSEFSWLERLIGLAPGSTERKFRRFLEYRERILFARAAWKRQMAALAAPVPLSQQARRIARKAARVARKAAGLILPRMNGSGHGGDATQPKAAGLDIGLIYHQACKAYVPRPYRGPAHVLWPCEMPLRDAAAGWGSVMSRLKLTEIPGGHFSSLQGENLLTVSEKIRDCFIEDHA